jgi:hypothetical protein
MYVKYESSIKEVAWAFGETCQLQIEYEIGSDEDWDTQASIQRDWLRAGRKKGLSSRSGRIKIVSSLRSTTVFWPTQVLNK